MRLDKFLKVSRLIKRRTVAKEVADKGRVFINDKMAKSSTDVKVGDKIAIQFGNKHVLVQVEALMDSTRKEDAKEMFTILEEKFIKEENTDLYKIIQNEAFSLEGALFFVRKMYAFSVDFHCRKGYDM